VGEAIFIGRSGKSARKAGPLVVISRDEPIGRDELFKPVCSSGIGRGFTVIGDITCKDDQVRVCVLAVDGGDTRLEIRERIRAEQFFARFYQMRVANEDQLHVVSRALSMRERIGARSCGAQPITGPPAERLPSLRKSFAQPPASRMMHWAAMQSQAFM